MHGPRDFTILWALSGFFTHVLLLCLYVLCLTALRLAWEENGGGRFCIYTAATYAAQMTYTSTQRSFFILLLTFTSIHFTVQSLKH